MLINTGDIVPELNNPISTATKKFAKFASSIDFNKVEKKGKEKSDIVIPGLDVDRLKDRYGPDNMYAPRLMEGTFRIPIGTRWATYEKIRNEKVRQFVNHMSKMDFEWVSSTPIKVVPGVYPARDVMNKNVPILDERECIVQAYFVKRNPEVYRIELDPKITNAFNVNQEFARKTGRKSA
jgi:hypothetical protein